MTTLRVTPFRSRLSKKSIRKLLIPIIQEIKTQKIQEGSLPVESAYPLCQHVKFDGVRCGSPALRNKPHCFYHNRVRRLRTHKVVLPLLENAHAINFTIQQTIEALLNQKIDRKDVSHILFGLKIASLNLKQAKEPAAFRVVTEDPSEELFDRRLNELAAANAESDDFNAAIDDRTAGLVP